MQKHSIARSVSGARWNPRDGLIGSDQGLWLDPSDLTTMFQDVAGTTPVTAVEQPVGLLLDKSKGLVLGPELVTNGTFDTDVSGWTATAGANLSWVAGSANVSFNAIADVGISQVFTRPSGYSIVTATITRNFTGATSVNLSLGGYVHQKAIALGETITLSVLSYRATAGLSTVIVRTAVGTPTGDFTVDNISVRELPGNHAYQTVSTKRPVLSSRVNLLTKTEDFSDAFWAKSFGATVSANSGVAPDGTTTADTVTNPNTSGARVVTNSIVTVSAGTSYTGSISTKALTAEDVGKKQTVYAYDVQAATFKGATTITLTADWQRTTMSFTTGASTTAIYWSVGTETGTNDPCRFYIWGASLVPANQASLPYQRVNTATDYDTQGFPAYLKFDKIDDAMQTNSIDFSATDKMTVFAGVRKLSDAAQGILVEISQSISTNIGAFCLQAPGTTPSTDKYAFGSTASSGLQAWAISLLSSNAAPVTSILTGLANTSAPSSILRVNGTQAAISTADQGTGNYGNYPLYIGARAGTSLFFNGYLYQLVICGRPTTVPIDQITRTEEFVNRKTKAY